MPAINRSVALITPVNSGVAGGAKTSTVTGAAIDTDGINGGFVFIQQVDTVSGTTPTLDGKIQESDASGGTYTDVSGATFTQVTASTNIQTVVVDRNATKRFLKYIGTIAGTSPSFALTLACGGVKQYR